jgi:hypothetical protein
MTHIRVTNCDVLALRGEDGTFGLSQYKNHIGNSRFEVLVDMYREAFELSEGRGQDDECRNIVDRLVEVVCHKHVATAVTRGRLLFKMTERGPEDDWNECDETQAKSLVREVLCNSPFMDEPLDEPFEIADLISSGPSNGMMQSAMLGERKRGRRRSLLRRSASESTMLEDKKKAYRPEGDLLLDDGQLNLSLEIFGQQQRSTRPIRAVKPPAVLGLGARQISMPTPAQPIPSLGARQVSMPTTTTTTSAGPMANGGGNASDSVVSTENAMDVILDQNCRKLSQRSNRVGNNRLQVMLSLQKGRFPELSPCEQDKVAGDLVKAVCQYWGGRILAEDGYSYNELGHDKALDAMKALLSPANVPNPAIAPIPTPSSSVLINGNEPPTKTRDLFKPAPSSSLLANAPQPPEFLKHTSMEILRSHIEPDESNMQSAAIRSLQQRKAKRCLAKKLG